MTEPAARNARPLDRVLVLLDLLLRRAALIVEGDHPLGGAGQVGYDKPDARIQFARMPIDLVSTVHREAGFDVTFVKADGARMRLIKAPQAHEPQIPSGTETVIPVVSARVIGQPLTTKIAHRPELVAAVTGVKLGETLQPVHLARLLVSKDGALRGTGKAHVVPVINMVDDTELETAAGEAASKRFPLPTNSTASSWRG